MKLIYQFIAVAGLFLLAGSASAQKSAVMEYDDQKQANAYKQVLTEQVEIDKYQLQEAKVQKAMGDAGYVQVQGFTYDPEASKQVNDNNFWQAMEALKLSNPTEYEQKLNQLATN